MSFYKQNFLYISVALAFVACDSKLLDRQPYDKLVSETYYTNQAQLESGLTGLYIVLGNGRSFDIPIWDGYSDNSFAYYDYGGSKSAAIVGLLPTSGGFVSDLYTNAYQGIARINSFEEVLKTKVGFLAETDKNKYLAEAAFLRAYFYFWLARTYGNVPLYVDTKVDADNPLPNSPRANILAQIHKDLDFAIVNLPDKVYEGHAVKASAQALKMHAYLLVSDFANVISVYNTFSSIPQLADDFKSIFLAEGQKGNKEILFSIGANPPSKKIGNYDSIDLIMGGWAAALPTKSLAESFETKNGLLRKDDPAVPANDQTYANMDPRFEMTLIPKEAIAENRKPTEAYNNCVTGFLPQKFLQLPYGDNPPVNYGYLSPQDYVLLRYADVLLMFAEAENEVNGPTQLAYDAINKIRGRKGVGMPNLPTGLPKEQMRERIWRERRVELALENSRYFDLRRWDDPNRPDQKMAVNILNGLKKYYPPSAEEAPGIYKPHYEYWPFNQQILQNNKNAKQNPGY